MATKGETVSEDFETDTAATHMVGLWMKKGWILNSLHPDFHVDYIAQPYEEQQLTGTRFCIQQKASQSLRISHQETVSASVKAKHLLYYALKERLPVFLFAVDVSADNGNGEGYYLFLQEWIDQNKTLEELQDRWKDSGAFSVDIPIVNSIKDSKGLKNAVDKARSYMLKKHPGSVEDAVNWEQRRIEAIDPRLKCEVNVLGGKKQIHLTSAKQVTLQLSAGAEHFDALRALAEFGKGANLTGDSLAVTGSPLFDGAKIASVSIGPANTPKGVIYIWSDDAQKFRFAMPVQASVGSEGMALRCQWEDAPFGVELTIPKAVASAGMPLTRATFIWNCELWENKRVQFLPHHDACHSYFLAIKEGRKIQYEIELGGLKIMHGTLGPLHSTDFVEDALMLLEVLKKLSYIIRHTKTEIAFREKELISAAQFGRIDWVYRLLTENTAELQDTDFSINFTVGVASSTGAEERCALVEKLKSGSSDVVVAMPPVPVEISGISIPLPTCRARINTATYVISDEFAKSFIKGEISNLPVKILGGPGSKLELSVTQAADSLSARAIS